MTDELSGKDTLSVNTIASLLNGSKLLSMLNRELYHLRRNYRFEKFGTFSLYEFRVASHLSFESSMAYTEKVALYHL